MAENKKTDNKPIEAPREYIIPLRERCRTVPRYKKTNKAVRTVKEFLVQHMKIRDRDLNKVKIDTYLNEFLWNRGIKHPPHKVKVRATKEGDIVRAELAEMPKKLEQKKARETKREEAGKKVAEKKKAEAKKPEEKPTEEKPAEEKEKMAATVEAGKEMEKAAAKQMKHTAKKQERVPTSQRRSLQR